MAGFRPSVNLLPDNNPLDWLNTIIYFSQHQGVESNEQLNVSMSLSSSNST